MATTIQSIARASRVLLHVAEHPGALATEIADTFDLSLPTTHHILSTLVQEELLQKDAHRRYELGEASERIGTAVARQVRPAPELRAAMSELARRTGESCYLTSWRADRIAIVATSEGHHAVRVAGVTVGYTSDIHARVGARVMLAFADEELRDWALADCTFDALTPKTPTNRAELDVELARIREQGMARDDSELRPGVYSISAPIRGHGRVRAALSLTAPVDRFHANEREYVAALLDCAAEASRTD